MKRFIFALATGISLLIASIPSVSAQPANYQDLWWAAPAGSESGWGINFNHQGDVIFATWFTYDTSGKGWWLVMTADKGTGATYTGTLYETRGPAWDAVPFSSAAVTHSTVGSGTLVFTDANTGTFAYTVNGISQTKVITRQVFGALPTCVWGALPDLTRATNYQDLWWAAPADSESGWGVNFTHQGDTIFATWFTYDHDGTPMWLTATAPKTAPGVYSGTLYRTTGPAFNAVPFPPLGSPGGIMFTPVGTLAISFTNGNSATFAYTIDGVSQTKPITRQVFRPPGTVCSYPPVGPRVTDKVLVANPPFDYLPYEGQPCSPSLSIYTVATLAVVDVCTPGIGPFVAPVRAGAGTAHLGLYGSTLTIDIASATLVSTFKNNGTFTWVAIDSESRIFATRRLTQMHAEAVELNGQGTVIKGLRALDYDGYVYPMHVAVVGDKVFVVIGRQPGYGRPAASPNDWVVVLNKNTGALLATISVNAYAFASAYDPKRGRIYVSSRGDDARTSPAQIVGIDVGTLTKVVDLEYPKSDATGLFVDTATDELWVASRSDNTLDVYDLAQGRWSASIRVPFSLWPTYLEMVYTADGKKQIWVAYQGWVDQGGGPGSASCYSTDCGGIGVFDATNKQPVRYINTGRFTMGITSSLR